MRCVGLQHSATTPPFSSWSASSWASTGESLGQSQVGLFGGVVGWWGGGVVGWWGGGVVEWGGSSVVVVVGGGALMGGP